MTSSIFEKKFKVTIRGKIQTVVPLTDDSTELSIVSEDGKLYWCGYEWFKQNAVPISEERRIEILTKNLQEGDVISFRSDWMARKFNSTYKDEWVIISVIEENEYSVYGASLLKLQDEPSLVRRNRYDENSKIIFFAINKPNTNIKPNVQYEIVETEEFNLIKTMKKHIYFE